MSDIDISIMLLKNECGKVLAYKELYPVGMFSIAYDYLLGSGCWNRQDYENLVIHLIKNTSFRDILLRIWGNKSGITKELDNRGYRVFRKQVGQYDFKKYC